MAHDEQGHQAAQPPKATGSTPHSAVPPRPANARPAAGRPAAARLPKAPAPKPAAPPKPSPPPVNSQPARTRPEVFSRVETVQPQTLSRAESAKVSRRTALIGGGVGLLAVIGVGAWALSGDDEAAPAPSAPTTTVEVEAGSQAPGGWSDSPRWKVGDLTEEPRVVVHGSRVFALSSDTSTGNLSLVCVDGRTGKQTWSAPLPSGTSVREGPMVAPAEGSPHVFLKTTDGLLGWDAKGGGAQMRSWKLPLSGMVVTDGGLLMPYSGGQNKTATLLDGKVKTVDIPKGFVATQVLEGGKKILAQNGEAKAQILDVSKNKKITEKKLVGPRNSAAGTWLRPRGDYVYQSWVPKDDPRSSIIRCYRRDGWKPLWTAQRLGVPVAPNLTAWEPGEDWAMISGAWVNLSNGDTLEVSSNFTPVAGGANYVWSKNADGNYLAVTDKGVLIPADPKLKDAAQITRPVGQVGEYMLATSTIAGRSTLYAFPRDDSYRQVKPGKVRKASKER